MREYTLSKSSVGNYKDKRSNFHATAESVTSVDQIKSRLSILKEDIPDANHICYAYRIKNGDLLDEFSSDAGEPKGSAGLQILHVLKRNDLVNSVIFVIRHFGGIKLGIPGLVYAYGTAAENAVEHATLKPWVQLCSLLLVYQYKEQKKVKSVLKQYDVIVIQQNFTKSIETTIEVRDVICEELIMQLEQITNGTIQIIN